MWIPLVGECLQCVKEPAKEVNTNATNSHCKKEMAAHLQQEIYLVVSMFLSLPHSTLYIFATGKQVNHGGKQGLEIPANFYFYGYQKAIELAKNEIAKIEENLNKTVKYCLK